jgi:DNA-binding transcriptional LysR family regulator
MHRRHQNLNIPIEIVRTVVAISETGSLTKAGGKLGLSQPAVTAQIKRIQALIGGEIFEKTPNGTAPTRLGKLVLHEARRMLEANDQILRLGGMAEGPVSLRLGISTILVEEFFAQQTAGSLTDLVIHTDNSLGITKGLIDGYIDVACVYENPEIAGLNSNLIVRERDEQFVWVRSRDFVLSPGAAIPLLTWPGDDLMIDALKRAGNAYRIVFNSPDYHAKIAALKTGLGLAALPSRLIPSSLIRADEDYLPVLPSVKTLLCARRDLNVQKAKELIERLTALFFGSP